MNGATKRYHHYVAWSAEDQCFAGYCPDLSRGGMCHDENPVQCYRKLVEAMDWFIEDEIEQGRVLPEPSTEPVAA